MANRKVYERDGVTIEVEPFSHPNRGAKNRERPAKIDAMVRSTSNPGGKPAAPPPISGLELEDMKSYDLEDLGSPDDDLANFDRGHLIALELGGPNIEFNIVPMFSAFNRKGPWRQLERRLRKMKDSGQYKRLSLTIEVRYGNDGRIPSRFLVWVRTGMTELSDDLWDDPILHRIPARVKQTIPDDLALVFDWGVKNMPANWGREFIGTWYPTQGKRPYEVLSYIYLHHPAQAKCFGEDYKGVGNFYQRKGPSQVQRKLILMYNRWAYGDGFLVSDDPADNHKGLNEMGADDCPEIDHIVPGVRGGSNDFRNFRLISWDLNNRGDRIKSMDPLYTKKEASELGY